MSMPMNSPSIGAEVYTADGSKLGTIKEVQGLYFKVDAPMQPDYWLSTECLRGGSGMSRCEVEFDKDHLADYRRDIPGM